MKITLKGDVVREFENGSAADIAKQIGAGLYKSACAAKINNISCDLRTNINEDCKLDILTFADEEGKRAFHHTASHILAQAVKRLYPNAKFAIGPAIENGFYYDFDVEKPFSRQDLDNIEKEMKSIVKQGLDIERLEMSAEDAKSAMKNEPYKLELIQEHAAKGDTLTFYKQGEFIDLCAGPHLMNTSAVKAIKLTSATGAYWRGDSTKAMLCRVYGTAFPKASELEAYLEAVEQALARDHNKIGRELKYFTTAEVVGQGLPILMPKGAKLFQILNRYVQDKEEYEYGYVLTRTPIMAKSDLYKISGHWDHYRDGMFVLGNPEDENAECFALRPMTCPFQYQVYLNEKHSYRDLPIRYGETSSLFRNEASGEMHGLIRLRQFTISEGHIILTREQLNEEFKNCVKLAKEVMDDLGLSDSLTYRLSKWDESDKEKYIGTAEVWDETQNIMREMLNEIGLEYAEADGEAAFYGPKLDIQIKNVYGKEDTLITVQIDPYLAKQFGMTYIDKNGKEVYPYIIHRTSLGCYERTIALLIEKYAGALPVWLSPEQVRIIPVSDAFADYAQDVLNQLKQSGVRAECDWRSEKVGYKIRQAQLEKVPYMLIVGEKEVADKTVSVRARKEEKGGVKTVVQFIEQVKKDEDTKEK